MESIFLKKKWIYLFWHKAAYNTSLNNNNRMK